MSTPKGCQLPQEEVWSQPPAEAQEQDQELEPVLKVVDR